MNEFYSNVKEWTLCLFSKKHAAHTHLRIDHEAESKVLKQIDIGLLILSVLALAVWVIATVRYNELRRLEASRNLYYQQLSDQTNYLED